MTELGKFCEINFLKQVFLSKEKSIATAYKSSASVFVWLVQKI